MITLKPTLVVQSPPRRDVARTVRKIGLCGSHSASLHDAPWSDPSWEFWGHSSSHTWYARPMDRYFDLHPKQCWTRGGKKTALYPKWLAKNTIPIYMQDYDPEVPASIKYPKGRILAEFGDVRPYFTNHIAWMIALALTEGVTTIGLWGVNYAVESEYNTQRGSAEFWLGIAAGRGVRIVLPEQCTLLRDPAQLYGYDSHLANGALREEYKRKIWKPSETIEPIMPGQPFKRAEPPEYLKAEIALEEEDYPRPEWAHLPPSPSARTNGGVE